MNDCIEFPISDGVNLSFTSIDNELKPLTNYLCTNVVHEKKIHITICELEGADTYRSLFKNLGMKSYFQFVPEIEDNFILNCTVTVADVCRTLHIYWPKSTTLK